MPQLRAISCKQRHGAQQLVSYIGSLRPRAYAWRLYLHAVAANLRIVRKRQYYGDNNELVELSVLRQNCNEFMLFCGKENDMVIDSVSHFLLMLFAGGTASLILAAGSACAAPRAQADLVEFEKMTWVEVKAALAAG